MRSAAFIVRQLVASEVWRWSWMSSLEARSPFEYSTRLQAAPLSTGTLKLPECQGVRLANGVLYGGWRTGVKGGLWTDRLLSLKARALLAAVSLTTAWQRNLLHSKRRLNGSANSAATCDDRPLRFDNGGFNKALMPSQAAGLSPLQ